MKNTMKTLLAIMITLFNYSCNDYDATTGNKEPQVLSLEQQKIGLTSVDNARQLGGYRIGDKQVRQGLLLRTASLGAMNAEDAGLLVNEYHLAHIFDFRSDAEQQAAPDIVPDGVTHHSLACNMGSSGQNSLTSQFSNPETMMQTLLQYAEHPALQEMCREMYNKILFGEETQHNYQLFFQALCAMKDDEGAVLWHCTQGKDRAGCASALLLGALGADRELIMMDFTLSRDNYQPMVDKIPTETEAQRTVLNTLVSANPAIFEAALDSVDRRYGSLDNYLRDAIGVTDSMKEKLRNRYLQK